MTALVDLLVDVFYPMNHRFIVEHNDAKVDHYWANWDLCNLWVASTSFAVCVVLICLIRVGQA